MKRGQGDAGFLTFVLFVIMMSKVAEGAAGGGKPKAKAKKKVVGSGVGVCKWLMGWPSTHPC